MARHRLVPIAGSLAAAFMLFAQPAAAQQATARRAAFATRALVRGAALTPDDFVYRDTTLRAPADTAVVTTGWVTRRTIAAGEMLREPAVVPPALVLANEPVEIVWASANVSLTMRGTATGEGALGDHVTVRTEQGKRIEATVVGPGRVRID